MNRTRLPRGVVFWLIAGGYFAMHIGTNVPSPLYGVYERRFGFGPAELSMIFAVYAFSTIISLAVFGGYADAAGRKRFILLALGLSAAASILFIAAPNAAGLFLARGVQGVSTGALGGAATAALTDLAPRRDARLAAVVSTVAMSGGAAVGPIASGLLAQYLPGPLVLSYSVQAGVVLVIGCCLLGWVERPGRADGTAGRGRATLPEGFGVAAGAVFVSWATVGLFLALVPSYVVSVSGSGNLALRGLFPFLMLGSSCIGQLCGRRLSYLRGYLAGLALLVAGLGLLVLAFPSRSLTVLLLGSLLSGAGHGIAFVAATTSINVHCAAVHRARIMSRLYIALYVGVGAPVVGAGVLAGQTSLFAAMAVFAGGAALVAVLTALGGIRDNGRYRGVPERERLRRSAD